MINIFFNSIVILLIMVNVSFNRVQEIISQFQLLKPENISNNNFANKQIVLKPLDNFNNSNIKKNNFSTNISFSNTNLPRINSNTRVLHIGDSHTAGTYGKEMDRLMRSTGATVETFGSASSRPSHWVNGYTTTSGYFGKDQNEERPQYSSDWKKPRALPKLKDKISSYNPGLVVISLGANIIGANEKEIEKQVRELSEIAKSKGAKIIWVGPPNGKVKNNPNEKGKDPAKQEKLYKVLDRVASEYGTFVDSRQYTKNPITRSDGVHFSSQKGTKSYEFAINWTNNVFNEIQNSKTSN